MDHSEYALRDIHNCYSIFLGTKSALRRGQPAYTFMSDFQFNRLWIWMQIILVENRSRSASLESSAKHEISSYENKNANKRE